MRRMGIGLGVGINRSNYAQGIFNAYSARVVVDGGITEGGACVDAVSGLLLNASLLLIPSGYKGGKLYSQIPTNGNGDLTWTRGSDAFRTNASGVLQRVPWNLLQQSNGFDSAVWVKSASSVASTSVSSPLGPNAYLYSISNVSTNFINQPASIPNTINTFSVFVKKNSGSLVRLNLGSVNSTFNFDTQSISNPSIMSFQSFSNGWFLLSLTANPITNTSTFINVPSTGSVSDSFYIATAQLVEGTTAQTYLPTTDRLNFPRLSYMYGSCPAVLLEPQRTNLVLQSQDFDNAYWTKSAAGTGVAPIVTANLGIAPDGTTTADRVQLNRGAGNTVSDYSVLRQQVTVASTATTSISIYIKSYDNNTYSVVFSNSGVTVSQKITVTNQWQRVTLTGMSVGTIANIEVQLREGVFGITGQSVTADLLLWGAQLEAGAYPTTYIPTTSATATRVADSFIRNNIYTNGLISAGGGTWFVELRNNIAYVGDAGGDAIILGDNSTAVGAFFRFFNPTSLSRTLIIKTISGVNTTLYATTTDTVKVAIKWNGTTADLFVNGTKVVSATSFTATSLQFLFTNITAAPKFIQQMALHPTPLSDTDCSTLTTL